MTEILKGKPVAERITEDTLKIISSFAGDKIPKIGLIRLGDDPSDISYEKSILKYTEKIGIGSRKEVLANEISTEELIKIVEDMNNDDEIGGIMILRPLPSNIDEDRISRAIARDKDIDCMNPLNLAELYKGNTGGFLPCTSKAIVEILKSNGVDLSGRNIVVVNRTVVVGKPVAMLLLEEDATVTICHSKTKDLKEYTSKADIVITAMGRAKFFDSDYFRKDSIVVDVGMSMDEDGRLSGDLDIDEVMGKVRMLTPVLGGIGSITTSILINQMVEGFYL